MRRSVFRSPFRISRALLSLVTALVIAFDLVPAGSFAYDYSEITGTAATGAAIYGYEMALAIDVTDLGADKTGKKDSYKAIQEALDYAKTEASDTVQLKVVIPEGKYKVSKTLNIYSDTWVYMKGATLIRTGSGSVFRNANKKGGGYGSDKNIIIEGGCIDGNCDENSSTFQTARFAHLKNLWIKDVEFAFNNGGHLLEIGGAKNVTIENCVFRDYYGSSLKEAIQLDTVSNSTVFAGFEPFDETPCDNVVIRNNLFRNYMRGVGTHTATLGVYYTNITVSNNRFENIYETAVRMQNYKNCTVENNTMTSVGGGVDVKNMTISEYKGYNAPNAGYDGIYDKLDNNANCVIKGNTISAVSTAYVSQPYGILLYGRELTGSYYPDYNYRVEGVKVLDNKISTECSGILMYDAAGVQLKSNSAEYTGGEGNYSDLIAVSGCEGISVQGNSLKGGTGSGLLIDASTDVTVKDNFLTQSGETGIYVTAESAKVRLTENIIRDSRGSGIKVTDGAYTEAVKNTVESSSRCGVIFAGGAGSVKENDISGSGQSGISIDESASVEIASNNYSGNAEGDVTVQNGGALTLSPIKELASDGAYEDRVQLSWEGIAEADSYTVLRRTADSEEDFCEVGTVNATSFMDMGLDAKTSYEYKVEGVKILGEERFPGKGSDTLTVRTKTSVGSCTVDMDTKVRYCGRRVEPVYGVYCGSYKLEEGTDYTIKYVNNASVGQGSAVICGKGRFCGYKEVSFDILMNSGSIAGYSAAAASSESYDVRRISGDGFVSYNSELPLIASIHEVRQQAGVDIATRRVVSNGDYVSYGWWL